MEPGALVKKVDMTVTSKDGTQPQSSWPKTTSKRCQGWQDKRQDTNETLVPPGCASSGFSFKYGTTPLGSNEERQDRFAMTTSRWTKPSDTAFA